MKEEKSPVALVKEEKSPVALVKEEKSPVALVKEEKSAIALVKEEKSAVALAKEEAKAEAKEEGGSLIKLFSFFLESLSGFFLPKRYRCTMKYIYLIRSLADPEKRYVGITSNPARRLEAHNDGMSTHTNKYRPWEFTVIIQMRDNLRAEELEKYLKSGSGRAFANRHLW